MDNGNGDPGRIILPRTEQPGDYRVSEPIKAVELLVQDGAVILDWGVRVQWIKFTDLREAEKLAHGILEAVTAARASRQVGESGA